MTRQQLRILKQTYFFKSCCRCHSLSSNFYLNFCSTPDNNYFNSLQQVADKYLEQKRPWANTEPSGTRFIWRLFTVYLHFHSLVFSERWCCAIEIGFPSVCPWRAWTVSKQEDYFPGSYLHHVRGRVLAQLWKKNSARIFAAVFLRGSLRVYDKIAIFNHYLALCWKRYKMWAI